MKTRKLELFEIAGYLPYGLMCVEFGKIAKIGGFKKVNGDFCFNFYFNSYVSETHHHIELIMPILRPLSDLYNPIQHNGKEIVPAAKILSNYSSTPENQYKFSGNEYKVGLFYFITQGVDMSDYEIFDYLHKLKIDYRNLIDDGLAISVYDLENNPYK